MSSGGVMLSGWLKKSPPENKLKSRHHSWKKRWFVLKSGRLSGDPNVLEYSKYQTSKKPIKTINLNDCKQIDKNIEMNIKGDKKDAGEHFIFSIVTSSRTFYLVADSSREMSTWVQCLCDLCGFNHDNSESSDSGRQGQSFRAAQPNSLNVNGATNSSIRSAGNSPVPAPRPERTLTSHSRPVVHQSGKSNGTVNSSFSLNGYNPSESKPAYEVPAELCDHGHDFYEERVSALMCPEVPVMESQDGGDASGYLHLSEFHTETDPSSFLLVDKTDVRRCSTDSVFTHGDGSDTSKDDEGQLASAPLRLSRFHEASAVRLDSMPNVPPPPPPTGISAIPLYDDDEDDAVDAPRRRTPFSQIKRLPPIDDSSLHSVPPGLQNESALSQGSFRESNSSRDSSHAIQFDMSISTPEYINTQDGKLSGSSTEPSLGCLSTSTVGSGYQIYDTPSPISPVFPLSQTVYQVPSALTKSINLSVRRQGGIPDELNARLHVTNPNESFRTTADESSMAVPRRNKMKKDTDFIYSVPSNRPVNCSSDPSKRLQVEMALATGSNSNRSNDQVTYDIVRHKSPSSPPLSTVITESMTERSNLHPYNMAVDRNAISASCSPLATPDASRRNSASKSPLLKRNLLHSAQNKAVSGSAPSIYDVPQALYKMPKPLPVSDARLSVTSSASGDSGNQYGSSARNSTSEPISLYDTPQKLTSTLLPAKDDLERVDDTMHSTYEKMAALPNYSDDASNDASVYTAMAGVMSTPDLANLLSPVHPTPPPVHRDLKPGRRSLGSDGGSSQSSVERRKNNVYESDEAVSPPHTSIAHTIPLITESKSPQYGVNVGFPGSRTGSMASQHSKLGMSEIHTQLMPPQRPPKSGSSIPSPISPSTISLNRCPSDSCSPTHATLKQQSVPERPPKPPNMRFTRISNASSTDMRMPPKRPPRTSDEACFAPSRPPKPSVTPSTGDSLHSASSLQSSFFPHSAGLYGPSSVVPPPPASEPMDKEIKYIEISTHTAPRPSVPDHERSTTHEPPVEYIQLDSDRTRALAIMKKERQNKQKQRANPDTPSSGKNKE